MLGDVLTELKPYAALADDALLAFLSDVRPADLGEAVRHYPAGGGKRLRPAVALLAAEAVGGRAEDGLAAAVAAELIHDFSLVHDDIMDGDDVRRGQPTVHAKWGDALGILAGDALLAKAFEALADARVADDATGADGAPPAGTVRRVLKLAARTTMHLCEGQALDMAFESRTDVTHDDYVAMIDGKTAALYRFAAEAGAVLGGASDDEAAALARWGRAFGLAFQVRDDVLDVTADEAALGKTVGKDVVSGKKTLLLLAAQEQADAAQARVLADVVGRADATVADVARVVDVFQATGALAAAARLLDDFVAEADAALAPLAGSQARDRLQALARWSARRDH